MVKSSICTTVTNTRLKQQSSLYELNVSIGFIYWIHETHNHRGLVGVPIELYRSKLKDLMTEYNTKYPNGLTGWTS